MSHLFSAQLAAHDSLFSPYKREVPWRKIAIALLLTLAGVVWMTPSFRLARALQTAPEFKIPDTLQAGELFSVPAAPSLLSAQLGGRPLNLIAGVEPIWLGSIAASESEKLTLELTYRAPERKWHPKKLLPKFEHPSVPVFAKQIPIDQKKANVDEIPTTLTNRKPATVSPTISSAISPILSPVTSATEPLGHLSRDDGPLNLACWKNPEMTPILNKQPVARGRGRQKVTDRFASVSSAGAGEVTQVITNGKTDNTVVVYHGGGLYSRFMKLNEVKVKNGEKIKRGQAVGVMNAGSWRHPASVEWDLHLDQARVNAASFLALSTRLCDSK